MALLEIHTFPDSVLRQKAEPVTVFDQELDEIAQSMLETMYFSGGIGLAAIQAGILKQIIVIDLKVVRKTPNFGNLMFSSILKYWKNPELLSLKKVA